MHPLVVALIVGVISLVLDSYWRNQEIRQAVEANDRFWNELINENQKFISEAYERGEPVRFNIERR